MSERYTITAALPYTNGPIHIGHLAGVYVPADIFARYQRLKNNDVAFICGSDEHGVAISIKAKKEGTTPKEIIDKYHKIIKDSLHDFGISFDNYSRTSLPIHYQTASEFFRTLYDKGDFIEETSEQVLVLSVATKKPMVTNVSAVVLRSTPPTLSTPNQPLQEANLSLSKPNTGFCLYRITVSS